MANEENAPPKVSMEVLRDGSFDGTSYHTGDKVDVDESLVETLTLSGFAARSDRVARAKDAREAAKKPAGGALPATPDRPPNP